MKILLFGKNGQVGRELQRSLAPLGDLVALDRYGSGDLMNLDGIARTIRELAPDIIVNAAAYTAVDKAEHESELAMRINAQAPAVLARESAAIDAWLVHFSTDYVFDGRGSKPWQESDPVAPLNCYGKSKLEGEIAIQRSGCKHLIFRTSWVYGLSGKNFVNTILKLASERDELQIVVDQIGTPTGADLLADVTAHALRVALQKPDVSGLYHVAPNGEISWYDFAHAIVNQASALGKVFQVKKIRPILSAEFVTPAQRPANSRLSTIKLSNTFSLYMPSWEHGVFRMLGQIFG